MADDRDANGHGDLPVCVLLGVVVGMGVSGDDEGVTMIDTIVKLIDKFAAPVYAKTGFYGALAVAVLIILVVAGAGYMGWL